ncbi:heavy metal translocating P-type ATPase [Sporolactobacillus vineae]|uniref:heavy metal translocating P-type ATPase n=1 Tax=Sporolactobacillus vineae TaxID=444463 RepID=UPI0002881676|nr:heavy metal translocating P-type ATPase [Sporolactobacillus vineae]
MTEAPVRSYHVDGFDCMACARTFEKNVRRLEGVTDAQVNYIAARIRVTGSPTVAALEKAGAFEHLKIREEAQQEFAREPFWKQRENFKVYLSALILIASWITGLRTGEQNLIPIIGFIAAILIGGYKLFIGGIKNIIRLDFDFEALMTMAIIGAMAIGKWQEGAIVVILFAVSETMERFSGETARQSIRSLIRMAPNEAVIRCDGQEQMMPVSDVQIGDVMIVRPGEKLAMDGVVVKGQSAVSEAAITGEPVPAAKSSGDTVFAGTLNGDGLLEVRVTKRSGDTTLAKVIRLVEEAQEHKAHAQTLIDRFAQIYTPVIIVAAFIVAVAPPLFTGAAWTDWIYRGLALLVVGCPCALVISTPVAIVTAIGNAAKHGVMIKGGIHLEQIGALNLIAFDKTGTLTRGVPEVTDFSVAKGEDRDAVLRIFTALEKGSQHPLAAAIVRFAEKSGANESGPAVDDYQSLTGRGVRARIDGTLYYAGSPALFREIIPAALNADLTRRIDTLRQEGQTVMLLGNEQEVLALAAVTDRLRSSSAAVINKLDQSGIKTVMLTGDNRSTAEVIGKSAGVGEVQADLLPEDKLAWVKRQGSLYKIGMVGDGINDAPALAEATVGIAMGASGTDTALETADIALMGDELSRLPYLIQLSRKTLRLIRQNVSFALGLKLVSILLIFPGWLTLWMAIFADVGATIIVTLNSLRLAKVKG